MAHRGSGFSFSQCIHVRTDIFISMRSMTTTFGKEVDLQQLTQIRLMKGVGDVMTSISRDELK